MKVLSTLVVLATLSVCTEALNRTRSTFFLSCSVRLNYLGSKRDSIHLSPTRGPDFLAFSLIIFVAVHARQETG